MSTDLELSPNLPKTRLPFIKIHRPSDSDAATASFLQRAETAAADEGCRTPTSAEHKIPAISTCPPAPRKPRRAAACKRKLSEFEFFEAKNRKEVDGFFLNSGLESKRRCAC